MHSAREDGAFDDPSVDNGHGNEHGVRVDLGAVPAGLAADDGVHQEMAVHALISASINHDHQLELYRRKPVREYKLSHYRDLYLGGWQSQAARMLKNKGPIVVDQDMKVDSRSPEVNVLNNGAHLDMDCAVGYSHLDAVIPNTVTSLNYQLTLVFTLQNRRWLDSKIMLGSDPANCMLQIGTCQNTVIWLMLYPNAQLSGGTKPIDMHIRSTDDSRLSKRDYRCLMVFMAWCLSRAQILDAVCQDAYPSIHLEDGDMSSIRFNLG